MLEQDRKRGSKYRDLVSNLRSINQPRALQESSPDVVSEPCSDAVSTPEGLRDTALHWLRDVLQGPDVKTASKSAKANTNIDKSRV